MLTPSLIADKFAKIKDISPATIEVKYKNVIYSVIRTNIDRQVKYSEFGINNSYNFSIIFRLSELQDPIESDELLEYNNKTYRILPFDYDSVDACVTVHLGNEYE